MLIFLIAMFLGLIPAAISQSKGSDFIIWWIYGTLLFIIALPHSIIRLFFVDVKNYKEKKKIKNSLKKCPMCAEMIKKEAIKCKHCGADIKDEKENVESTILMENVIPVDMSNGDITKCVGCGKSLAKGEVTKCYPCSK